VNSVLVASDGNEAWIEYQRCFSGPPAGAMSNVYHAPNRPALPFGVALVSTTNSKPWPLVSGLYQAPVSPSCASAMPSAGGGPVATSGFCTRFDACAALTAAPADNNTARTMEGRMARLLLLEHSGNERSRARAILYASSVFASRERSR